MIVVAVSDNQQAKLRKYSLCVRFPLRSTMAMKLFSGVGWKRNLATAGGQLVERWIAAADGLGADAHRARTAADRSYHSATALRSTTLFTLKVS